MITPIDFSKRYFSLVKSVSAKTIVFSDEVRKLCVQNRCGNYDRNWTCPPAAASIDEFRKRLSDFDTLLIMVEVCAVKDSFDWKGMMSCVSRFKDKLQALKKEIESADEHYNFVLLGIGACNLCTPCNYTAGKPCRHPQDAIVSLEACGIDVMRMLKDNGLTYYHGIGTITCVGGLFYNG